MPFVVEDGTGLSNATSYVSVADARAYWADVGVTFSQTDTELEQALVAATRYIELRFSGQFRGHLVVINAPRQRLSWPRYNVWDCDGLLLASDEVPEVIKNATSEYMRRALESELLPDPSGDPFVTRQRDKVGPVETETERLPGLYTIREYPFADSLIEELTYNYGEVIR